MRANDEVTTDCIKALQTDNDHLRAEVEVLSQNLEVALDQIRRMLLDRECVD